MDIPVYLFTGFIESGKTCFIKDMLNDESFNENEKNLLILTEEGIEGYDQNQLFDQWNCVVEYVSDETSLTSELLNKFNKKHNPERVLIEYNGMWSVDNFLELEAPLNWVVAQIVTTVNAATFEVYINNMRSQMREHLAYSDLIVFNRADAPIKKSFLRNNAKSINQRAQLIYEDKDGVTTSLTSEDLPYNMSEAYSKIEDQDYGIWYMDALENPQPYKDKHLTVKGQALQIPNMTKGFAIARNAMVCCADDIQPIGFLCYFEEANQLAPNEWVEVTAEVDVIFDEEYGSEVPILKVIDLKVVPPLEEEFVYFS